MAAYSVYLDQRNLKNIDSSILETILEETDHDKIKRAFGMLKNLHQPDDRHHRETLDCIRSGKRISSEPADVVEVSLRYAEVERIIQFIVDRLFRCAVSIRFVVF